MKIWLIILGIVVLFILIYIFVLILPGINCVGEGKIYGTLSKLPWSRCCWGLKPMPVCDEATGDCIADVAQCVKGGLE